MASMSYAGAARGRGRPQPPLQGVIVPEEGHTVRTEGAMRNNFTVDILKLNGEDFKGTIKHTDAIKLIFVRALGFTPQEFAGAIPGYRGNPTVLFKTKEVFNIDQRFAQLQNFSFIKRVQEEDGMVTHTYDCSIRGVRAEGSTRSEQYTWIKVEGADYQLEPSAIRMWLMEYGTLMSELTEDKMDMELSSDEEELYQGVELTTGNYSVKMRLEREIPQFLPIDGKRIRIYHRGIKKLCSKCFYHGHIRKDCKNEEEDWFAYVDRFMVNSNLDDVYFGRWVSRMNDWKLKNPDLHRSYTDRFEAEKTEEEQRREERQHAVGDIVQALDAQAQAQRATLPTDQESSEEKDQPSPDRRGTDPPMSSDGKSEKKKPSKQKQHGKGNGGDRDSEEEIESRLGELSFERIQQYVEKKGKGNRGKPGEAEKGNEDKRKTRSSTTKK